MKNTIQILFTIIIISSLNADWELNITAEASNGIGASHTIQLGRGLSWSDGWKFGEDESDYPNPFSGEYTNIHFFHLDWYGTNDDNGNTCNEIEFSSDLKSERSSSELVSWGIRGYVGGGLSQSTPITLSWDSDTANLLPNDYDLFLYIGNESQNMRETSSKTILQSELYLNGNNPNITILMGACAATGTSTHYYDSDEDGWGGDSTEQYCLGYAPNNWVNNNLDINDSIYCESNQLDCEGTLCGNAELDECGVCNGNNLNQDCSGNCYGTSIIANLCQDSDLDGLGDPESSLEICTELPINNNLYLDSNGSIFYNSNEPFYGLQFDIEGADIINAFGGIAEESGFIISTSSNTVITFSLTSNPINPGTGNLINLVLTEGPASLSSLVVSDISGNPLDFTIFTDYQAGYASNCSDLYPNCTENYFDCTDECGGSAIIDECGECNGNGASEGFNCAGYPELFSYNSSSEQAFYFFTSITLDDENLEQNDWIGAFNGEICVGARQWNSCEGGICDIPVLGMDNTEFTSGYMSNGDIPHFKIYDASENAYFNALPSQNIPWIANAYNWLDSLSAISAIDYCLDLHYGANLKSFYALPSNTSISNIMENIEDVVTGIITEGGACSQITDGIWAGSQCSLSEEKGYWIITEAESELCLSDAILLDPNIYYDLHEGANLISIPIESSIIISEALPDDIEFYVTGVVTEGGACTQLNPGNWVGSQCSFVSGRGYWLITLEDIYFKFDLSKLNRLNVSNKNSLKYPVGYKFNQSTQQAFYFVENIKNLDNNNNNWILAFYNNKIIGSQKWNGDMIEITIMGYDGNLYSSGYIENGMKPILKLLNTDTGKMIDLTSNEEIPNWSNNSIFNLNSLNAKTILPSKIIIDTYPNPFNPSTSISFSTISEGLVEIVIFNISGQLITTLVNEYKTPGNYQYNWDASSYTSGVYFAQLQINETFYSKKLILMK